MRNLKRALSLALASVMVLGLMIVGSSAKTDQFSDAADINGDYKEAIDVLTTIGVLEGVGDGSYDPQGTLTREMAAKLVSVMILGQENADRLGTNAQIFKDVAAGRWSAGYIAYCANTDPVIIAGDGTGNFDPEGKLTGVAFGKMLLTALGYDASIEGYVNTPSWAINVASDMVEAKLDVKGITLSEPISREAAAQMALNAIKSPLVEYEGRTQVNVNGAEIIVGGDQAKPVLTTVADENTISQDRLSNTDTSYTVEFGERYIKDLKCMPTDDEFMRPAHIWTWKNEEIDTYVNWDMKVAEYTYAVSGKTVYDALTRTTLEKSSFKSYLDGTDGRVIKDDLVRSNTADLADTGNGVLTQVFLDTANKMITMTSINTWLAKATGDYSSAKEYAPFEVYTNVDGSIASYNIDVEEVPEVVDVVSDDYYLINISYKDIPGGEVVAIQAPKILDNSTVTKFTKSSDYVVSKLTTDGTEYKAAKKAFYDNNRLEDYDLSLLTDMTYNIYLDQYDYAIGVDLYEGDPHYVFITGYDRPTSNLSIKTADAAAIFLDGSMENIKVNVSATDKNILANYDVANASQIPATAYFKTWGSNSGGDYQLNRWFSYSKNESGVYTLKPVTMVARTYTKDEIIKTSNVQVRENPTIYSSKKSDGNQDRAYANQDSVFITVDLDDVDTSLNKSTRAITEVTGVYTGVQDVELEIASNSAVEAQLYAVYDKNYFIVGAVAVADASGSTSNYAYILSDANFEQKSGDTYYWGFDAIIGGEIRTDLVAKSKYPEIINALKEGNVQELRFDDDGYVVKVIDIPNGDHSKGDDDEVYELYEAVACNATKATPTVTDSISHPDPVDLTDYSVYDVRSSSLVTAPQRLVLKLEGLTLYVTADRSDMGLALAAGAKAITIQRENGKNNIRTPFTSVSAAISHLADPVPGDSLHQYNGRIVAILNAAGAAEWVVFVNNEELKTGTQQGYTPSDTVEMGAEVDTEAKVVYVNALVGTSDEQIRSTISAKFGSKGITVNRYSGSPVRSVVTSDGYYDVEITYYYRIRLNGNLVEYVEQGSKPSKALTLSAADYGSDGSTGFIVESSQPTYYKAYGQVYNTTWTINRHIDIWTGYIKLDDKTISDISGSTASGTNTVSWENDGTQGYAKIGETLIVTLNYTASNMTSWSNGATVALVDDPGATTTYDSESVASSEINANKTVTLSFKATADVPELKITETRNAAPISLTTSGLKTSGQNVNMEIVGNPPTSIQPGADVTVTVSLTGTVSAPGATITLTPSGSAAASWVLGTTDNRNISVDNTLKVLKLGPGSYSGETIDIAIKADTSATTISASIDAVSP